MTFMPYRSQPFQQLQSVLIPRYQAGQHTLWGCLQDERSPGSSSSMQTGPPSWMHHGPRQSRGMGSAQHSWLLCVHGDRAGLPCRAELFGPGETVIGSHRDRGIKGFERLKLTLICMGCFVSGVLFSGTEWSSRQTATRMNRRVVL